MSGHSKWATTKHQKAVTDARRGAAFTKIANMITIAAREGGDPEFNFKLRLAVEKAKSSSMPKDNIERAITRGTGKGEGANKVEELTYEAYGPGGSAIIVTALSDNKIRAFTDIRATMNKFGGRMAEAGSVSYMFDKKGQIIVAHKPEQADNVQLAAIDMGADDVDTDGELTRIITSPHDLQKVRQGLIDGGFAVDEADLKWVCKMPHELSDEDHAKLDKLIDNLDLLDDVSTIDTNVA
jgi:YebC/PmpR family DNA-binding regulatory protein